MAILLTPEILAAKGDEHGEQMAVFQWCAFNHERYPVLRRMFAIPNGGGRSAREGGRLKAEGVKRGVCDIMLPVPSGSYHGLFIEMKRRNGVPSNVNKDQKDFIEFVKSQGYCAEVAFGWEQAVRILESYLSHLSA